MECATDSAEFVGIAEAARRVERSAPYVLRMVARGLIRTRNEPGFTTRYNADDLAEVREKYGAR